MKRWLIVLCLAAATAPGFAAAATRSPEEAPLWKRLLAVIVPSVPAVRQPAAAERHSRHAHARWAATSAEENSSPLSHAAPRRQDRQHLKLAAPGTLETSPPLPRGAPRRQDRWEHVASAQGVVKNPPLPRAAPRRPDLQEHVGLAATGAMENSPPVPHAAPPRQDREERVGAAVTVAEEDSSPPLPEPAVVPVRTRPAANNGDCNGGQRIVSAYYWQGRRTASGEPFNPRGMTAAHRTLPFGTRLNVINPRTGQSVSVVINDRGPFVRGASLDLSLAAAKAIGMRGTATVCIL